MAKATLAVQVLTVLVLVWIGMRLEPRRDPDPTAWALQREFEALRTEIVAGLADAARPRGEDPQTAAAAVPVPGPDGGTERTTVVSAGEDRLAVAAAALERAAARLGGTLAAPTPHQVPAASNRGALSELRVRLDADDDAVTRSYLFWPLADVLQRFGRPDHVYSTESGAIKLHYLVGEPDEVVFLLHDGFVIRVWS